MVPDCFNEPHGSGFTGNLCPTLPIRRLPVAAQSGVFTKANARSTGKADSPDKAHADFAERFEELIESCNAGSRNIEELSKELLELSRNLSEEQQRHVRENMTEEELVIFDILTRPAPELSADERAEVKKVARELLARLKSLLLLDWRKRQGARARVEDAIKDVLDTGLPRAYNKPLYEQKCSALFEHIFESYPERDANPYANAA